MNKEMNSWKGRIVLCAAFCVLRSSFCIPQASAQQVLSLDSCRVLALRNNKQLNIARLKQDLAYNTRKAARTKYLPKVDALAGYEHVSKEVSLLKDDQKEMLSNLGTNAGAKLAGNATQTITALAQQGVVTPQMAQQLGGLLTQMMPTLAEKGNEIGQSLRDAFRTDTRNIWAGALMLRQPVYLGGAITAANRMADIGEEMAANDLNLRTQLTIHNIDQTYWTVVSLRQKQKLAESYYELVKKLNEDVHKMIDEGVATRADGLKVDVRVNEAEMQCTQVEDGVALAKMLLCQLCGLPSTRDIVLADENRDAVSAVQPLDAIHTEEARLAVEANRPELRMLQNTIDLSRQATKIIRAAYLPQVALTAGFLVANPNPFNGFEKEFAGAWNVGVIVRVPVWNWFEGRYKVRAAQAATNIATMEKTDAQEKIDLQIEQCKFNMNEANKRLLMAQKNIASAEENLRCANVGFSEGVMQATDVMAAQTAWQMAQSQKIDAEVEVRLAQINLQKALGELSINN